MTIESLFMDFLETPDAHTGPLASEMHRISAELDQKIKRGDADGAIDLMGDYELAAMRFAFFAGVRAAKETASILED